MKTQIVFVFIFSFFQSVVFGYKLPTKTDTTRLYIENKSSKQLVFNINSVTDDVKIEYRSNKEKDTVVIFHQSPLHLVTTRRDSINDYVHTTFVVNSGENIYIQQSPNQLKAFIKGNSLRNNELAFYTAMQQKLGNYEGFMVENKVFKKLPPVVRLQKIKELYAQRKAFLVEYAKKTPLSAAFIKRVEKSFYYRQYTDFLTLYLDDKTFKSSYPTNKPIADFIKNMEINENFCDLTDYADALQNKLLVETLNTKDYNELYQKAKRDFTGNTRNVLIYKVLMYAERSPELGDMINDYVKIGTHEVLKRKIIDTFGLGKTIEIKPDKSNDISDATIVKLATKQQVGWENLLKTNKPTYVDFWASWCGACRDEMRNTKKLKEEYRDKGIEFIYISVDENIGSWENASKKEGLPEENSYLLPSYKKSAIAEQYNIRSFPHYMIIGTDGSIINANAPRLSDPKIRESFDELLKK